MELNQLRTLVRVAELGSLSKASDRLRIAQPALSRHIRMLEEELGVELFKRHGRGMLITEAGRRALDHANRALDEIASIRRATDDAEETLGGRISIGMPPTIADILSPPVVETFGDEQPAVAVRIASAYSSYLLDWLHQGELDLAILFDGQGTNSLHTVHLVEEDLFLVSKEGYGTGGAAEVPFGRLVDIPLLLPSRRHSLRLLIEERAEAAGVSLAVSVEADSFSILTKLVSSGRGATILPLASVLPSIQTGLLVAQRLIEPALSRKLLLAKATDRQATRLHEFGADTVMRRLQELVASGAWAGCRVEKRIPPLR